MPEVPEPVQPAETLPQRSQRGRFRDEEVEVQIGPYLNPLRGSGNYAASNATHKAMVEALTARDGQAASKALRDYINDAYAILAQMLR